MRGMVVAGNIMLEMLIRLFHHRIINGKNNGLNLEGRRNEVCSTLQKDGGPLIDIELAFIQ